MDDITAASTSLEENMHFSELLRSKWEITELREPKYTLGIVITQDCPNWTISISQIAKIDHLVEEYGQANTCSTDTPMVARLQLCRPDKAMPMPLNVTKWVERTSY